ncbi:5'-methylthioadenosine/adenosylhomocysteine nucleosidase [Buchnera aphidicola]|uniref:adenosylhomocysteine nucleosidase n=1 Tax=Buchnera aphidicola (Anoecia oenotherae) TaxID=1241833 RepID=A0A4D6XUZ2_9GAMM|nr:5'-methylthioadenosine/adenosylhomocysteine nucleosidase [Buchnera aphidicola]QCI19299.1 5'-methylthioadenosine/adenosylhomocysteine nucleosidase [Buchnera aphidicola (Anoecia oenotherae)]
MQLYKKKTINNHNFYDGYICNTHIILVKSGIGKVFSSIITTLLIKNYLVNGIINIGSCGRFNEKLNIGDVIISNSVQYHDVNLESFGYKNNQIAGCPQIFHAYYPFIQLAQNCSKILKIIYFIGNMISGDSFITNTKKIKIQNVEKKPLSIDMESASIAQVCFFFQTPFISIRSISDLSNKNSVLNYYKNRKKSIKNYSKLVLSMLKNIRKIT